MKLLTKIGEALTKLRRKPSSEGGPNPAAASQSPAQDAPRDWKAEIAKINELCEQRKREMQLQLANGGRIIHPD